MALKEKCVVVACVGASMTYVTYTSNSATLLAKLRRYCPLPVEVVAELDASRGAVVQAQKLLNGDRAHDSWFDGLVDEARMLELLEEGSKETTRPGTEEWVSWRFQVENLIACVGSAEDVEVAREAWADADAMLREMGPRVVVKEHAAQVDEFRARLDAAAAARASS